MIPVRVAARALGRSVAELMLEAEHGPLVVRQRMAGLFVARADFDLYRRGAA